MKLDAELMFECLIYLNVYHYPVLAIINSFMAVGKYYSIKVTPNIGQDACVSFACVFAELAKILLYNKYKNTHRDLITGVAVVLTCITVGTVCYVFFIQNPVTTIEYIVGAMTILLAMTEVIFGILQLMPCLKKVQYY